MPDMSVAMSAFIPALITWAREIPVSNSWCRSHLGECSGADEIFRAGLRSQAKTELKDESAIFARGTEHLRWR